MRMSFCLMLRKITAQFFANTESLESQKGPAAKKQLKQETAESLHDSVDVYGLQSFSHGTGISDWIMDGRSRMPSSEYIQCIKVRVLPNNLRISRYHPEVNTYCDSGCGALNAWITSSRFAKRKQREESGITTLSASWKRS